MTQNSIFLEQNCLNALKTCNFDSVTGPNCASEFCNGFPSTTGTCPQIGLDPQNCCGSSDPAACLGNWIQNGGGAEEADPCASVVGIILECSSAYPALFPSGSIYTSGPQATSLASCMCYDSDGTYDPNALDGFAATCVSSGSAAHPTYYPYASRLLGFCTNNAGPANAAASTTGSMGFSSANAAATSSTPGGSSSANAAATSSTPVGASSAAQTTPMSSNAAASSAAAGSSSAPASTATAASAAGIKTPLQAAACILLGFSMLLNLY